MRSRKRWGLSWIPERLRKTAVRLSQKPFIVQSPSNSTWDTIHFKILVSIALSFCVERIGGRQESVLLCSVTPLSLVRTRMLTDFFFHGLVWSIVADFSIALTKYYAHNARSAFENLLIVSDVASKYVVFLLRTQKSPEWNFDRKTDIDFEIFYVGLSGQYRKLRHVDFPVFF
jgi:hypothetical protein